MADNPGPLRPSSPHDTNEPARAASASFAVHSFARSDIGRYRKTNEDAHFSNDEIGLYIVADGMGGHAAGEIASA